MKVDDKTMCRWCELNPHPLHYVCDALPLSCFQNEFGKTSPEFNF